MNTNLPDILRAMIYGCKTITDPIIIEAINTLKEQVELSPEWGDEEKTLLNNWLKSKLQYEATVAFKEAGGFGSVIVATGGGKSKIAVDLCRELINRLPTASILLAVPTDNLKENWMIEFLKWGFTEAEVEKHIRMECYVYLPKIKDEVIDFMIMDEGHNITPNNAEIFKQNLIRSCLLLTATEPNNVIKNALIQNHKLTPVYKLSLDQAVSLGIVAPFDIVVVNTKLNVTDKTIKGGNKAKPFYQSEASAYAYLSRMTMVRPSKMTYINRYRFFCALPSKTDAANMLLEHVIPKDLKTLIFCGSIDQAHAVCENSFHSKNKKDDYLNAFKKNEINRLSCVEAINEGQDIDDLDCALILQMNSNELDITQRIGRTIRFRPNHRGTIIVLCVGGTVDESWAKTAMRNFNGANIRVTTLEKIRTGEDVIIFN